MATYTKETALYDTGAIRNDMNNARQVATGYLADINGGGVYVHSADTPSESTAATAKGVKITDKVDVINDGVSISSFGEDDGNTVRVGKADDKHILINSEDGISIADNDTVMSTFNADGVTIGIDGTYQTSIFSGGFSVSDGTGYNAFSMEPSDETISRGYSKTLKLTMNEDHIKTQAPLDKCSVTFTVTSVTPNVSATYTNSTFAVDDVKSLGTTVFLHRRSQTMFDVHLRYKVASSATVKITYTMPASATTAKLTFSGANTPLFTSTGNWMRDTDAINLSEPISMQLTGIVMAWSEYADGETKNYGWKYTYIPKNSVLLNENQGVSCGPFATTGFGYVGNKYLYITDSRITGHANNIATGTASSGIKYDNSHWVLRYVWGV